MRLAEKHAFVFVGVMLSKGISRIEKRLIFAALFRSIALQELRVSVLVAFSYEMINSKRRL